MAYKGYDFFYVNGSSHTAGGGFETLAQAGFFGDKMITYYKEKYNVSWKSHYDVAFAAKLSKMIKVPSYNWAKQGGGLDRVVRLTYDFIDKFWKERHKFFIILETPDASRVDLYYNPIKDYLICNINPDQLMYGTPSYFPKPSNVEDCQSDVQFYQEKFYNYRNHHDKNEFSLLGLYSFCKRANISIKLMSGIRTVQFPGMFLETDLISGTGSSDYDIYDFAANNKLRIKDETNGEITDGHPGYFGHIEYAKFLKDWLDVNLEPAYEPTKYMSNL